MFQNNYLRLTSMPIARSNNDRIRSAWIYRFEQRASDGWSLHFLTILFRANVPPKISHAEKEQAVYDAYSFFRSQVYRRPNSELMDNAPQLLGFLEEGSVKQQLAGIPNGCHFHGLLAIPPTIRASRQQHALERMTRLLPERHAHIARVHTEPVKSVEKAIRYASKQIRSRGDREWDPIIAPLRAEERLEKPANVRRHETPETTLIRFEASNASSQNPLIGDIAKKKTTAPSPAGTSPKS